MQLLPAYNKQTLCSGENSLPRSVSSYFSLITPSPINNHPLGKTRHSSPPPPPAAALTPPHPRNLPSLSSLCCTGLEATGDSGIGLGCCAQTGGESSPASERQAASAGRGLTQAKAERRAPRHPPLTHFVFPVHVPSHLMREGHASVEEAEPAACRLRDALGGGFAHRWGPHFWGAGRLKSEGGRRLRCHNGEPKLKVQPQ